MTPQYQQLPSGKTIFRQFDSAGQLASETHAYGAIEIALTSEFTNGAKVGETYILKNRLVSRSRYEQAREKFADMPPADASLEDTCGALVKAAERERRQQRTAAKVHKPDPEQARQINAFCLAMMERGQREDAVSWIESSRNTLGELAHSASRKLVVKLSSLGCKRIHACEIDYHDEDLGNTGHLVVELPAESDIRKRILREIDRLAESQGYSGDFDDGQQYAYVKLD